MKFMCVYIWKQNKTTWNSKRGKTTDKHNWDEKNKSIAASISRLSPE